MTIVQPQNPQDPKSLQPNDKSDVLATYSGYYNLSDDTSGKLDISDVPYFCFFKYFKHDMGTEQILNHAKMKLKKKE